MAFPPGTYVSAAVLIETTGIGPGTIAASGTSTTGMTLTYAVTNKVNVQAFTRMRIQVANANNPPDPSNSADSNYNYAGFCKQYNRRTYSNQCI